MPRLRKPVRNGIYVARQSSAILVGGGSWQPSSIVNPPATINPIKEASMIKGVHTMFYSSEPEGLRTFIREKLGFPYTDVGGGWLIFDLPEAEMGCHPAGDPPAGEPLVSPDNSM